ncbi:MAG TPA: FmdB family zinc ribbon protein [Nitrospiraceae bacterium]|nr:FmdB family zinc ribbon protein [Nitrospiraceae bacterium]
MPIYEYVCDGCGYRFERKQSIKDDPIATCERCGKSATRLISSPAIMFKGSGWYVTDYSDKLKPPAGSEPAAAATAEKGAAEKKETPAGSSASTTPASSPSSSSSTSPSSSPSPSSEPTTPTSTTAK